MSDSNTRLVGGFLAGAVIGAGLAYLFAPASGKETRRRIADGAEDLADTAQRSLGELTQSLKDGMVTTAAAVKEGRDAFLRDVEQPQHADDPH